MADTIKLGAGQTLEVIASTPQTLELVSMWDPRCKPPPTHYHPRQDEQFEVLEGQLTVKVGDEDARILPAGDTIDVPSRTAHSMRNAGRVTTKATWRISPALRTEEMFRYGERGRSQLRFATNVMDLP